jgi:NAD(P)-dependent dehydrogenase (short-subunit alcohol dehydrogenase family)
MRVTFLSILCVLYFVFVPIGLWAVINNAGVNFLGDIDFCTMDMYHRIMDVNLFGMVRTTKAFLPLLRKSKGKATMY